MNPGVTMNLVVKSGSNTFKGLGSANYQSGDLQSNNITPELLAKGYAPGVNKFTSLKDYYGEIGGPILRDRLWFYASHRDASSGNFIPGFIQLSDRAAGRVLHQAAGSDGEDHLSDQQEQQVRGDGAGRPQVAAVSHRQPLRAARIDAEPGLDVADRAVVQVPVDPVVARDVRRQPAARRLLVARRAVDLGRPQVGPGDHRGPRGAFLETDRKPRRWQYGGTFAYFAEAFGRNHELKTGYLGWRNIVDTENIGYPNQQQYRYRSLTGDPGCNEAAQLRRLLHAAGLGAGLRLPEHHRVG